MAHGRDRQVERRADAGARFQAEPRKVPGIVARHLMVIGHEREQAAEPVAGMTDNQFAVDVAKPAQPSRIILVAAKAVADQWSGLQPIGPQKSEPDIVRPPELYDAISRADRKYDRCTQHTVAAQPSYFGATMTMPPTRYCDGSSRPCPNAAPSGSMAPATARMDASPSLPKWPRLHGA